MWTKLRPGVHACAANYDIEIPFLASIRVTQKQNLAMLKFPQIIFTLIKMHFMNLFVSQGKTFSSSKKHNFIQKLIKFLIRGACDELYLFLYLLDA